MNRTASNSLPDNVLLSANLRLLEKQLEGKNVYVLLDTNAAHLKVCHLFPPDRILRFEAGEQNKNLATMENLAARLLAAGADRNAFLLGIGGGITTDVTGLLAALYMRGIGCGLVPTTLLAQVDASVGGKNGVNLEGYKNILGTFREPDFIYICPQLAATADDRCGIAEMLKIFLLRDGAAYARALLHFSAPEPRCAAERLSLIRRAVELKGEIVSADFQEAGERRLLNLGHTFGHALEKCTGGALAHGEAVSIGMVLAAELAVRKGLAEKSFPEKLRTDLRRVHLPVEPPVPVASLIEAVAKDKKSIDGRIRFVLPVAVGKAVIEPLTPEELL